MWSALEKEREGVCEGKGNETRETIYVLSPRASLDQYIPLPDIMIQDNGSNKQFVN